MMLFSMWHLRRFCFICGEKHEVDIVSSDVEKHTVIE